MSLVQLRLPEGFEQAVHVTAAELESQIRLMAALKMFELGKLSSGKAAELAGVSRVEFYDLCGRYQVPVVHYEPGELEQELETLAAWRS
jgi:predicted HTH domain antitoxin